MEPDDTVWLGVEFEWNSGRLVGEILILEGGLGLDMLKWGVGMGKRMKNTENARKEGEGMSFTAKARRSEGRTRLDEGDDRPGSSKLPGRLVSLLRAGLKVQVLLALLGDERLHHLRL